MWVQVSLLVSVQALEPVYQHLIHCKRSKRCETDRQDEGASVLTFETTISTLTLVEVSDLELVSEHESVYV